MFVTNFYDVNESVLMFYYMYDTDYIDRITILLSIKLLIIYFYYMLITLNICFVYYIMYVYKMFEYNYVVNN